MVHFLREQKVRCWEFACVLGCKVDGTLATPFPTAPVPDDFRRAMRLMNGRRYIISLQRLLDEPDLLSRLRANVRPPMEIAEQGQRPERLHRQVVAARQGAA